MDFHPKIGDTFLHVANNKEQTHLIYTKMGYLPNDRRAQKKAWKSGMFCNNGMNDCMTQRQFAVWWASQIETKFKKYNEEKQQTQKNQKTQ